MGELRRLTPAEIGLLIVVLAAAAAARAGYLVRCADNAHTSGPLLVQTPPPQQDTLVRNLRNHQRFAATSPLSDAEQDTAHYSPGYPLIVAGVGRLVAEETLPLTMRWVQCGLGSLTAGLYFLFARRAFRSTVAAALAGLLCAVHPFWVIDTAQLADGTLAAFLLALALFLGARGGQTGGPLSSLLYGLSLAALALVRAALLPFAFVALAWFLLRCRGLPRGWLAALLAFLGFVNGVAPWGFRNWQLSAEPLPVVDSAWYHLWVGNNPRATGGPGDGLPPSADFLAPSAKRAERDARLAELVRQEVRDHPAEAVRRRLRAGLDFVFGERWFTANRLAYPAPDETMPGWLEWSYPTILEAELLALLVLGLLGWRWTYARRFPAMPSSLALVWVPLPYVLSHAEALSGPRLPLDGVLLCYAAFAVARWLPGSGQAGEDGSAPA